MKRYDTYRPSGIDWIGDVPEHWEVKRLRFVCEFRNGYTPSKANSDFWEDGTIPWYRMEDIRDSGRRLNEAKQYVTEEAVKGGGLFEAGSFILATTATIGEHAMLIVDSLANQRFTNLKIRKSLTQTLDKEFFFYYLYVIDDFCKSSTRTATFPAMNMEDLRNFGVAIPPLEEQIKIVDYIGNKCEAIDKVIATQRRRVALLGELKQSIITQAVTRGLNPDAPLRPSGIDWIGEVPEHWEIKRLKFECSLSGRIGWNGLKSDEFRELSYAYLVTGQDFNGPNVVWSKCYQIEQWRYEEDPFIQLNNGDILITKAGTIGKIAMVNNLDKPACLNSGIFVMKQKYNAFIQKYLYWLLLSSILKRFNDYNSGGQTTIQHLYQNVFENMPLVIPPLSEQETIAEYLDKKCSAIDKSIAKAEREIELLTELKQSIITEAVTGKIKVTD